MYSTVPNPFAFLLLPVLFWYLSVIKRVMARPRDVLVVNHAHVINQKNGTKIKITLRF